MRSLPIFLRLEGKPVILAGEGEMADAKRRLLMRAGAIVVDAQAEAALAIVAIEDDAEAQATIAALKARGILVNAVDRPTACDFTLPAIVDRDPVLIAVGTSGASAGLAKALRIALEALLPAALGRLATALHAARPAIRARWPGARDRRLALDDALAPGGALDPLADHAADAVEAWLAAGTVASPTELIEIGIGSDDPDDLSLRQARLLGRADRVCHAPDIAPDILARARADAERRICGGRACDGCPTGLTIRLVRPRG